MKLIKVTAIMEKELGNPREIAPGQIDYLKYTKHYYLLENTENKYITEKAATFIQMDKDFDNGPFNIYLLDKECAEKALEKQVKAKAKPKTTKKTEANKEPKKEVKQNE